MKHHSHRRRAFTLLELLIVVTIIAVLAGLAMTVTGKVQEKARGVKEVNAARQLTAAYLACASDNDGQFMLGFDRNAGAFSAGDGTAIHGAAAHRYPYRLAPYFKHNIQDVILVNKNAQQVKAWDTYQISLFPAFGINAIYVGGCYDDELVLPGEQITGLGQAPGSILLFASAAYGKDEDRVSGFHVVEPPRRQSVLWSTAKYKKDADPKDYGYVDPRHGNRVLCAFLDGSVRQHSVEELRDMRLWNRHAAEQDNKDYLVARTGSGGRPGGR